MRTYWWVCICVGVLTCLAAYQHFNQFSLPTGSPGASGQSERRPVEQKPEQPLTDKDVAPPQRGDSADAGLEIRCTNQSPALTLFHSPAIFPKFADRSAERLSSIKH